MPRRSDDDDAFDKIVEGLDLDLPFPEPVAPTAPALDFDDVPDDEDDQFYRVAPPISDIFPRDPKMLLAWIAVLGAPASLVGATVMGEFLPRPLVIGICLVFVAGAIWLFSHLPDRPTSLGEPDDGSEI